jgi:D-erythrulose 1-phosphate 3-epimerase
VRLTLGVNNCFAVKRWPRPDEWAPIIRDELGLHHVQHSLDLSDLEHDFAGEAESIRGACTAAELQVESVFTGLIAYSRNLMLAPERRERERAVRYWTDAIRFAAALGASSVGGHVGSLSRADADDPARHRALWSELQDHLGELRGVAAQHGIDALLVENMASDREPSRMSELRSLMRTAEPQRAAVSLCLDVGHQCRPGTSGEEADPYAWLSQLGDQARVVHLQQSDAEGDHHWPFTEEYNRRGRISAPQVLAALAASGAGEADLILEVIPPFEADDAQVLADLRESVAYWREALG